MTVPSEAFKRLKRTILGCYTNQSISKSSLLSVSGIGRDRNSRLAIAFYLVQQTFVALSIFLTIRFATKISDGAFAERDFVALFAAMAAPFAFGLAANYYVSLWHYTAVRCLWARYNEIFDRTKTESRSQLYVVQMRQIASRAVDFTYSVLAVSVNFIVAAVSVAVFLDLWLGAAIALGLGISLAVVHFSGPRTSELADQEITAFNQLTAVLFRAYPNLAFGSSRNRAAFERRLFDDLNTTEAGVHALNRRLLAVNAISAITGFLPVSAYVAFVVATEAEPALLIALAINLPRIYQMLTSSLEISHLITEYSTASGYARLLARGGDVLEDEESQRWRADEITVNGDPLGDIDRFEGKLRAGRGLFVVGGRNGAGKSSLLRALCSRIGGVYFNPRHRLDWSAEISMNVSDGEYALLVMEELSSAKEVLLLDEFDANMDADRRTEWWTWIQERAIHQTIVVVSHSGMPKIGGDYQYAS